MVICRLLLFRRRWDGGEGTDGRGGGGCRRWRIATLGEIGHERRNAMASTHLDGGGQRPEGQEDRSMPWELEVGGRREAGDPTTRRTRPRGGGNMYRQTLDPARTPGPYLDPFLVSVPIRTEGRPLSAGYRS